MPPLHPAIVHYPVALTLVSVIADTIAVAASVPSLLPLGSWGMAIAAAGAIVAAAAGYWDMKRDNLAHETHEIVHLHMKSGLALATALVLVAVWRWVATPPATAYLLVGWALVAGIALQAWLGGEIVYAHGGGVAAAGQGTADPQEAKKPSRRFYRMLTGKDSASSSEESAASSHGSSSR